MAYAAAAPAVIPSGPYKELNEDALCRLDCCERQKMEFNQDIREGYFFTEPHRAREIRSATALSPTKPDDADTLQTGLGMELADDFVTEVVNGFMPQYGLWAEQRPGMLIPKKDRDMAVQLLEKSGQDKVIFDAIRASNLYEMLPMSFGPDIGIGTAALWIDDLRPAENFVVQAVPLHELEINIGPYGGIDDRFVVRHTKHKHLKALLGAAIYNKIPQEKRTQYELNQQEKEKPCIVRWGYWRDWDEMGDVVWQHVVLKDSDVVHENKYRGNGSCPLLPIRFNPKPEWAFGIGPVIKSLPDFRQLDELEAKKIEHIGKCIDPAMGFPDDSFSQIAAGVEDGTYYPLRPGSQDAVKKLVDVGDMQPAIYETEFLEKKLRRRFYLDYPQQSGDTPPTATQWVDQMQMALRRFGTPGASFWREGPAEIFLRFKHMLTIKQIIEPLSVNGRAISLEPVNPAQAAAEMDKVQRFSRFGQIAGGLHPEEYKVMSDGAKIIKNLAKIMRVEDIWVERSADGKAQAASLIAQVAGGQAPAAPQQTNGAAVQ